MMPTLRVIMSVNDQVSGNAITDAMFNPERIIIERNNSATTMQNDEKMMDLFQSKKTYQYASINEMTSTQTVEFMKQYLSKHGKVLDDHQKSIIIEQCKYASVPLFLASLLDEIKNFGSFENLNEYLQKYLNIENMFEIFIIILDRLEEEFADCNEGKIVKSVVCLIYCSRTGLTSEELKGCLEKLLNVSVLEKTFPIYEYSSLIQQLSCMVKQMSGLYRIVHSYAKQAIYYNYLFSDSETDSQTPQNILHKKILWAIHSQLSSRYSAANSSNFDQVSSKQEQRRYMLEVPYILCILVAQHNDKKAFGLLKEFLTNVDTIPLLKSDTHMFDFHRYWAQLEAADSAIEACAQYKITMTQLKSNNVSSDTLISFNCNKSP